MSKPLEIALAIFLLLSIYLLFNIFDEIDIIRERQKYYEEKVESLYDAVFHGTVPIK